MKGDPDENGWVSSAPQWISRMGDTGDFSRQYVLDTPMMARVAEASPANALDVGCGEGRFCRKLREQGIEVTGLDPVPLMIEAAQRNDPDGSYVEGGAEALPFEDASFDLVVSYLTLIDIDGIEDAIAEMTRVLRPNGRILVGNLTSFSTSSSMEHKRICKDTGDAFRPLGRYMDTRKIWFEWGGLRIQNWHRPLSQYMQLFLAQGLRLTYFDEPTPHGGPEERKTAYKANPYLMMMEWQKS